MSWELYSRRRRVIHANVHKIRCSTGLGFPLCNVQRVKRKRLEIVSQSDSLIRELEDRVIQTAIITEKLQVTHMPTIT